MIRRASMSDSGRKAERNVSIKKGEKKPVLIYEMEAARGRKMSEGIETGVFASEEDGIAEGGAKRSKPMTGTTLKIIAMAAMLIDHAAAIILDNYLTMTIPTDLQEEEMQAWFAAHTDAALLYELYALMRIIGRFGFPLFAYLLTEGFQHTRNVKKYAVNLGMFALISELIFNLGFNSTLFYPKYQNVFFTLLMGLLCMMGIRYLGETKRDAAWQKPLFYLSALLSGPAAAFVVMRNAWPVAIFLQNTKMEIQLIIIAAAGVISLIAFSILGLIWSREKKVFFSSVVLPLAIFCTLAELLMTDYGGGGVLTIAVMYLLRRRRLFAFSMGCLVLSLMSFVEAFAYFMLIPLSKYNGDRGVKSNKYFFYAFYPVHIGLLYLITLLLGFTTFSLMP